MNENNRAEMKQLLADAIRRMLQCRMPDAMRQSLEALLARQTATVYELKSAYEGSARRLVLSRAREDIDWNPTVDEARCIGCKVCYAFCPHGVFVMEGGKARVAHPNECVILCSNCMPRCPVQAIRFPPQTKYVELLHYE